MSIPLGLRARRGFSPIALVSGGAPAYNPAVLNLSDWKRGSYVGSPWTPVASAGVSGSAPNLTEATNPPAVGAAVNGFTPLSLDGVNDKLAEATGITGLTDPNWTVIALFRPAALLANAGGINNPQIFGDTGGSLVLNVSAAGTMMTVYDGAYKDSAAVATPIATWHMVAAKLDSATAKLHISKNAAAWDAGVACGAVLTGAQIRIGPNYADAVYYNGLLMEYMVATTALTAATLADIKSYFNARYALAL